MKETNIESQRETKVNPKGLSGAEGAGAQGGLQMGGGTPPQPAAETAALQAEEFLSKHELAQRLKRNLRTIERWQGRGIIPYVKCGHSVLFNWPEVVAHLQKNYGICRQRSLGEPVRLPVYQMRDETKVKTKCRGRTGLRSEATVRQASAKTKDYEN